MNMQFYRKLPIPMEIKEHFPAGIEVKTARERTINTLKNIFSGRSDKFILIIGPCSADREDAVLDYLYRLREVSEKVKDKILIVPRIYTNKPRTTGEGYKGMLHQPNPNADPDILKGIVATRKLHMRAIEETGFGCADEMLYPENHRYISDLVAYITVGARSVENQQHRLTASGLDIPVGMKNPTSGNLPVMINSIKAAQNSHIFCYRGWEVKSTGNPFAHAILRGYTDMDGTSHPNYTYDDILNLTMLYSNAELKNPACIIDTNHANSGKSFLMQPEIAKKIIEIRTSNSEIKTFVKGLMIESYIEDGYQEISSNEIYGKSITDPCLGWTKTESLIYNIAEKL